MARTALATQVVTRNGITPVYTTANVDGHQIEGTGDVFLHVKNAAGAPINVTVQTGGVLDGEAVADTVIVIPATTGDKMIGPFPSRLYNQPGTTPGVVFVDFSAITSVTVACIRN